jgi:hypothetical protein
VNKAFEDDSEQQDIQHKSLHANGIPIAAATTDKTKLVCVLAINCYENNFTFLVLLGRQIFSMAQYRLYASRSFKYVMTGNNELRRI